MHSNDFSSICGFVSGVHCTVSNEEEMIKEKQKYTIVSVPLGIIEVIHTGHAGVLLRSVTL